MAEASSGALARYPRTHTEREMSNDLTESQEEDLKEELAVLEHEDVRFEADMKAAMQNSRREQLEREWWATASNRKKIQTIIIDDSSSDDENLRSALKRSHAEAVRKEADSQIGGVGGELIENRH
eukprot:4938689-Prymnesium_polylepis.1